MSAPPLAEKQKKDPGKREDLYSIPKTREKISAEAMQKASEETGRDNVDSAHPYVTAKETLKTVSALSDLYLSLLIGYMQIL
jgi:hypothetical protein